MTSPLRRKQSAMPIVALAAGLGIAALVVAGAWYMFFRQENRPLTDDEMREIEAFEEYERHKGR